MQLKTFSKYFTATEQRMFMAAMKSTAGWVARRDYHTTGLMFCTGGRVGTILRLTVRDALDALAGVDLVFRDEISKGGNGYTVSASVKTREHLKALLAIRREQGLGLEPDAPLIVARVRSVNGEGMTVRAFQKRFVEWREKSGIRIPATPHFTRHTLGQRVMRNSTAANPLAAARLALGHRDEKSTAIYTAPTREEIARTFEEVSA